MLYTLSTAFVLSGLTGCGANDEGATGINNTSATRPIGYYSNENVNNRGGESYENGNAILPERDNDGPVTEILDRTGDDNRTNGRRVGNIGTRDDGIIGENHDRIGARNVGTNDYQGGLGIFDNRDSLREYGNNNGINNPGRPYVNENSGNRFSRSDYNYHKQMGYNNNERASYKENYNGDLAEKISNRVQNINNVDDVRTIVNGNNILVAIDTNDRNDKNVEQQVKSAIKRITNGKDVVIVTDEATFTRARNIDNELRNGGPTGEIDADIRDMFNEIGEEIDDAIRTPFRDTK